MKLNVKLKLNYKKYHLVFLFLDERRGLEIIWLLVKEFANIIAVLLNCLVLVQLAGTTCNN